MDKPPDLRTVTAAELIETLSFALRYDGRRRVHHADHVMARITADQLVQLLEMRKPPAEAPTTSRMPKAAA